MCRSMATMLALGLITIALAAGGAAASAVVPAASSKCTDLAVDVHYVFHVNPHSCNMYQPGNASRRGIHSNPYGYNGDQMRECTLVNNSFPGPLIRAKVGQTVRVDVYNHLFNTQVSFHWHGLTMAGYQWADGASYITSCPIVPGRPVTYVWDVDRAGTYFYHGHTGLDEEYGLSGAMVFDELVDPYADLFDEEWPGVSIDLRDWWRVPSGHTGDVDEFYFYEKFDPYGLPMFNGYYGNGTEEFPWPSVDVAVDTCYRTRIIGASTEWPGWQINITDEAGNPVNMTLLALTAENLKPMSTHSLAIYLAQRAEIIICTPSTPQNLNISIWGAATEAGNCQYNVLPGPEEDTNPAPIGPNCIDHYYAQIRVGAINSTAPKTANRTKLATYPFTDYIDSLTHPNQIVPLAPKSVPVATNTWELFAGIIVPRRLYLWKDRGYEFGEPSAPYLYTQGKCGTKRDPKLDKNATGGTKYNLILNAKKNEVIDIVFNNLSPYMHPMHLHGYRFTVIASKFMVDSGYRPLPQQLCPKTYIWADPAETKSPNQLLGEFIASNFSASFPFWFGCPHNASDPTNKQYYLDKPYDTDIVPVPAHSWTIVRVKFDNPGFWYMHCHVLGHMVYGMGMMINAWGAQAPPIPSWVDTSCGGVCQPVNQFCGPFATANCVKPSARDICTPDGFVPTR